MQQYLALDLYYVDFPTHIYALNCCISYWIYVIKLQRHRYVRLSYDMLKSIMRVFGYCSWV